MKVKVFVRTAWAAELPPGTLTCGSQGDGVGTGLSDQQDKMRESGEGLTRLLLVDTIS